METILAAVITGGVTLIGVLIANGKTQAVTETKLEELTREVRMHNNFAQRVPVIEEQLKVANHRHPRRNHRPHRCAGTGPRQPAAERSRQAGAAHRQRQRGAVGDRWPDHRCRHLGMVGEQQLYSRGHPRR